MSKETPNLLLVTLPVSDNLGEFFKFFSVPDFTKLMNPEIYLWLSLWPLLPASKRFLASRQLINWTLS